MCFYQLEIQASNLLLVYLRHSHMQVIQSFEGLSSLHPKWFFHNYVFGDRKSVVIQAMKNQFIFHNFSHSLTLSYCTPP